MPNTLLTTLTPLIIPLEDRPCEAGYSRVQHQYGQIKGRSSYKHAIPSTKSFLYLLWRTVFESGSLFHAYDDFKATT